MTSDVWETANLFDLKGCGWGDLLARYRYPWLIIEHIPTLISIISTNIEISYTELKPGVFVHQTAKISPFCEICAPAVIGAKSEIRRGAYLRGNTLLGEGCVVGHCCEVKNCILLDGATLAHFNYAGDSVLGARVHLGAGAVLSNLKADKSLVTIASEDGRIPTGLKKCGSFLGDGVEVGCNAVLNPGCVVGKGSRVYPLVSLRGCVPAGSIVKK